MSEYFDFSKIKKGDIILIDTYSNESCLCYYITSNVRLLTVRFIAGLTDKNKYNPRWWARRIYEDGMILFNKDIVSREDNILQMNNREAIMWIFKVRRVTNKLATG